MEGFPLDCHNQSLGKLRKIGQGTLWFNHKHMNAWKWKGSVKDHISHSLSTSSPSSLLLSSLTSTHMKFIHHHFIQNVIMKVFNEVPWDIMKYFDMENFFNLIPQTCMNTCNSLHYFMYVQHQSKIWFCTIALLFSFHFHVFIFYHNKFMFMEPILHTSCFFFFFLVYMFNFKIKIVIIIIFLGVYVLWNPFVLVIFMPMTEEAPSIPNNFHFGSWKSQCVFKIFGSRWGINIVQIWPSLNHCKGLEEYYQKKKFHSQKIYF